MKKLLILGVFATVLFQSCAGKKGAEAVTDLKGTSWTLKQINNIDIEQPDFARIPELNFDASEEKITGNTGCNSIFGTFKIDQNKITFGPIGSTKMACEGNGESRFNTAMNTVQTFKLTKNQLELFDGLGNEAMSFTKK